MPKAKAQSTSSVAEIVKSVATGLNAKLPDAATEARSKAHRIRFDDEYHPDSTNWREIEAALNAGATPAGVARDMAFVLSDLDVAFSELADVVVALRALDRAVPWPPHASGEALHLEACFALLRCLNLVDPKDHRVGYIRDVLP